MRNHLLLLYFSLLSVFLSAKPRVPYRFVIVTNANSCKFYNAASASVVKQNPNFRTLRFVFSSEDATLEQAQQFVDEMTEAKYKAEINDKVYDRVASTVAVLAMPRLAVLDTLDRLIFSTSIDSITHYMDIIEAYFPITYTTNVINNQRIRKTMGTRTLSKLGDYFFVTSWQNSEKVYVYDTKKKALDSLFITDQDTLLHRLIKEANGQDIDIKTAKRQWKENDMGNRMVQFGTAPAVAGNLFATSIDIMYIDRPPYRDTAVLGYNDPRIFIDTITTQWLTFAANYDPKTKKLKVHSMKEWDSDSAYGYVFDKYQFDYQYHAPINDSIWMIGGKKDLYTYSEPQIVLGYEHKDFAFDKPFFYYSKNRYTGRLQYTGKRRLIQYDSAYAFNGDPLNSPNYLYTYSLKYPYLFFNASPLLYNDNDSSITDIRKKVSKDMEWIFDMNVDRNVIRLLVQEKKNEVVLYTLNRKGFSIVRRISLGKLNYKNNIVLDGQNVFFMNKEGQITGLLR